MGHELEFGNTDESGIRLAEEQSNSRDCKYIVLFNFHESELPTALRSCAAFEAITPSSLPIGQPID